MKITLAEKERNNICVGDLIVGGSGNGYIVSRTEDGQYTLFSLAESKLVELEYVSIAELMEDFFSEYIHYPKENLELIAK